MSETNSQVKIMDSIKETELNVSAVLMEKKFTIGQLTALNPGSVLFFEKASDEPAQLHVNGKKVASGPVVQSKEHFAVQIQELA